jgi:hypothetical protein
MNHQDHLRNIQKRKSINKVVQRNKVSGLISDQMMMILILMIRTKISMNQCHLKY